MKLHPLVIAAMFLAPLLRAEEETKPPTEVAVQVGKVLRATLTRSVTAFGNVEPEPATTDAPPACVRLSPAIAGLVTEIHAVEGQAVKKGDVLFKLDSRATDAAKAKTEQAVEFATTTLERQRKLIAAEGTSAKQVMEAEQALAAAKTELAAALVQQSLLVGEAPISGTLVKFTARPGEAADATTVLAEIVDLDRMVAAVRVSRAESLAVKVGQAARVFSADSNRPIHSRIGFVSPQVDAATDTIAVRLPLPKDSGLHPGEFVTARITIEEHQDILAVPRDAVYTDYEGQSTLSVVKSDIAKKQTIKTGLRDGNLIEVAGDGLSEGTIVVTLGSYALPEETKVRILETPAQQEK